MSVGVILNLMNKWNKSIFGEHNIILFNEFNKFITYPQIKLLIAKRNFSQTRI